MAIEEAKQGTRKIAKTSPEGISVEQFKIQIFGSERDVDKMITVGPKNAGFDESLGYSSNELHELYNTLNSIEK